MTAGKSSRCLWCLVPPITPARPRQCPVTRRPPSIGRSLHARHPGIIAAPRLPPITPSARRGGPRLELTVTQPGSPNRHRRPGNSALADGADHGDQPSDQTPVPSRRTSRQGARSHHDAKSLDVIGPDRASILVRRGDTSRPDSRRCRTRMGVLCSAFGAGRPHVVRPSWRILLTVSSTPNAPASFPPLTRKM